MSSRRGVSEAGKVPVRGYVLYWCEHMRDGREEGARCFETLAEVEAFLNEKAVNFFAFDNRTFQLFEMGAEVPLTLAKDKVVEQTREVRQFKVGR